MQQFINQIVIFLNQIYSAIQTAIGGQINQATYIQYTDFLGKNVFMDNSLIGLNITWFEVIRFLTIWILIITFIVLFIKLFCSIVKIFKL